MTLDRRTFVKNASLAAAATQLHILRASAETIAQQSMTTSPNDRVQFALIGAGIQGQNDTRTALQVPGVKLVAVADCYDGRLVHSKELWGTGTANNVDLFTTRDYADILAGKDVYLEKPMIHAYAEGPEIISCAHTTNRILQVGSQRVSSVIYSKAKELLASGAIGQLNMVTARWDRNSSMGAWNYTVPADASPETCDWPRFLGTAPKVPWNPEHFFQWRKWNAYGSGVAGDLFVHLFSGTHFITGSKGPTRAMATGGLRFWKDGRNVPDVLLALFDYPEGFNLSLRVNFVDGGEESEGFLFTGSEGTMEIAGQTVTVTRAPREKEPGYGVGTFTNEMQQRTIELYRKKYPAMQPTGKPYNSIVRCSISFVNVPTP